MTIILIDIIKYAKQQVDNRIAQLDILDLDSKTIKKLIKKLLTSDEIIAMKESSALAFPTPIRPMFEQFLNVIENTTVTPTSMDSLAMCTKINYEERFCAVDGMDFFVLVIILFVISLDFQISAINPLRTNMRETMSATWTIIPVIRPSAAVVVANCKIYRQVSF
ncbi:hypothetical protein BDC45DRAFT_329040 [Circinella umbellata]|nr:hypothetical protein BDC45DRAFT_329040 [Circinella umbellata]